MIRQHLTQLNPTQNLSCQPITPFRNVNSVKLSFNSSLYSTITPCHSFRLNVSHINQTYFPFHLIPIVSFYTLDYGTGSSPFICLLIHHVEVTQN
eukprot:c16790_g1_i1 orf=50-334(-)